MGNKNIAALFSDTKGWTRNTVSDEKVGSKAGLATDCVWGVTSLLVRARQPDNLPPHMQEPPSMEFYHQAHHQKQVYASTSSLFPA